MQRDDLRALLDLWETYARPVQIVEPDGRPIVDAKMGRGSGKTRLGNEHTLNLMESWGPKFHGLVASKSETDTIETLVLGPAGLIACARRRGYELRYLAGRGVLEHPNGAIARLGSGEVAEQVRGPSLNFALLDELKWWKYADASFANVRMALRSAAPPPGRHLLVTSTPSHLCRLRLDDIELVQTIKGRTADNVANLDRGYLAELERTYDGHPLGRQELDAEDVNLDGAVASLEKIHEARVQPGSMVEFDRVVVGVDPGGFARDPMVADLTGIVVVAQAGDHLFVLGDYSIAGDESTWGPAVVEAAAHYNAGRVIVETNQGGMQNVHIIERYAAAFGRRMVVEPVVSRQSKRDRALGAQQQYTLGRLHHVGVLRALEDQITSWSPKSGRASPDRLDAMVHAVNALLDGPGASSIRGLYAEDGDEGAMMYIGFGGISASKPSNWR